MHRLTFLGQTSFHSYRNVFPLPVYVQLRFRHPNETDYQFSECIDVTETLSIDGDDPCPDS